MTDRILITGNTYPVKDALRALGGRWDASAKGWRVPAAREAEARALVAGGVMAQAAETGMAIGRTVLQGKPRFFAARSNSREARNRRARNWQPCGYPGCNPTYCDECDGAGRYGS